MKKRSKILIALCLIIVLTVSIVTFTACGKQGLSAYEVAVKNGFVGSEAEWLQSYKSETTVINYNADATAGSAVVAANIGLHSVVSVISTFTRTYTIGGFWGPQQEQTETFTSGGAGIVYRLENDGSAFIITNYHVVYHVNSDQPDHISENINIFLYGKEADEYAIPAKYVGGSMYYDVAVLRVDCNSIVKSAMTSKTFCNATFGDSDNIVVGQTALAIGNPAAKGISVSSGIISVDSEYIDLTAVDNSSTISIRVIRTDSAVNSGNSGGGLFDLDGKLIGLVNAKMNTGTAENIAYAIPVNLVKVVADNIITNCYNKSCKTVMRAMIGVTMEIAEMQTYEKDGYIYKSETMQVSEIATDSLASGKLQVGDILKSVTIGETTTQITRNYHFAEALLAAKEGDTVTISLERNNETINVDLTITANCIVAY